MAAVVRSDRPVLVLALSPVEADAVRLALSAWRGPTLEFLGDRLPSSLADIASALECFASDHRPVVSDPVSDRGGFEDDPSRWAGTTTVARRLGCTSRTVTRWCRSGRLVGRQPGGERGTWLIDLASVDAYERGKTP